MNNNLIKACIFDLDGVIVDTAKYHYIAWKKIAEEFDVDFTELENENLKGVSRMASLEYILKLGNIQLKEDEKLKRAKIKNEIYVELISHLNQDEILPGVYDFLKDLKKHDMKIALGSASKNSMPILKATDLLQFFDFIADGNSTNKSKPDPAVFLIAADGLKTLPQHSLVLEDSIKGIEAAKAGHFHSIGIGDPKHLSAADIVIPNLEGMSYYKLLHLFNENISE